jgi:hypothetical protein
MVTDESSCDINAVKVFFKGDEKVFYLNIIILRMFNYIFI